MRTVRNGILAIPMMLLAGSLLIAEEPPEGLHPHAGGGPGGFPDLVGGLKEIEGCLGVETAQTDSGKMVIFAWFEDKAAVLRWFYSDMHKGVMSAFFPHTSAGSPLADVPDGLGPIMAIASITMSDEEHFGDTNLPISQIAIEMYTPVTGGLFLGGRFAPAGVKVRNIKDYTPKN